MRCSVDAVKEEASENSRGPRKGASVTCLTLVVRSQEVGSGQSRPLGEWSAPPLTIGRRRSSQSSAQRAFRQNQERATKSIGSDVGTGVAFEARMQQLETALAHQMQINSLLQAGPQQQPQVDMTALGTTIVDEVAQAMRSLSQRRTVVDIEGIGKPAPVKRVEKKFGVFAQTGRVHECSLASCKNCHRRRSGTEWTRADRTELFRDVREFSVQLLAAITGLLKGKVSIW